MRIYVAGPMRGIANYNFPAFDDAAARGRAMGHEIVSPADMDRDKGFDERGPCEITQEFLKACAKRDLDAILTCDAIALLPGWRKSSGATAELGVANWIGLKVLNAVNFEPFHETAVQEAQRICYGDRNEDYGHPYDECDRMARLWEPILGVRATPAQVCLCLVQMKVSREINKPKRDNAVDIAGYAECLNRIREREAAMEK